MNPDTGVPSDDLTPFAIEYCQSIGSNAKTVSEVLSTKDEKIMNVINEGIERANEHSVSRAQKVRRIELTKTIQNPISFKYIIS